MSETNRSPLPVRRSGFGSGIAYVSILLLGAIGGFALSYSVQSPERKSDLKTYHFCLISSAIPITDFGPQIQAMKLGSVRERVTDAKPWTLCVNRQITSSQDQVPPMRMRYPYGCTFSPLYECEMKLAKSKGQDESQYKLFFSLGNAPLMPLATTIKPFVRSEHSFTLHDNQTRIIQLDSGDAPDRNYLYAMIMTHEVPWASVKNVDLDALATRLRKANRRGKPTIQFGVE